MNWLFKRSAPSVGAAVLDGETEDEDAAFISCWLAFNAVWVVFSDSIRLGGCHTASNGKLPPRYQIASALKPHVERLPAATVVYSVD